MAKKGDGMLGSSKEDICDDDDNKACTTEIDSKKDKSILHVCLCRDPENTATQAHGDARAAKQEMVGVSASRTV